WPITVESATLRGRPIIAPANPFAGSAVAALRLTLRCLVPDMAVTQHAPHRLPFFLRGRPQRLLPTYGLLHNYTVSAALADSATDPAPVILRPQCIQPVGFERAGGMLPSPRPALVVF